MKAKAKAEAEAKARARARARAKAKAMDSRTPLLPLRIATWVNIFPTSSELRSIRLP